MRDDSGTSAEGVAPAILSISPLEGDHDFLLHAVAAVSKHRLIPVDRLSAARHLLRKHSISVVVCEADLLARAWIEVLDELRMLTNPPLLIVTSRLADDRLWAEALNLGAWDVLAKPLDRGEVARCLRSACDRWLSAGAGSAVSQEAAETVQSPWPNELNATLRPSGPQP